MHGAISLIRTRFQDEAFQGARLARNKIAKLVIAMTYMGFGWLPTSRENNVDEWAWERVVRCGLVGKEEEEHLMALHPGQYPVAEVSSPVILSGESPVSAALEESGCQGISSLRK